MKNPDEGSLHPFLCVFWGYSPINYAISSKF